MLFLQLTYWHFLLTLKESELLQNHMKIESLGHTLLMIHC